MRPIALLRDFGAEVRARRKAQGLTQANLAEAAGIAVETVSRIEGGRLASLSLVLADRVAGSLGASIQALLAGVPAREPARLRSGERKIVGMLSALDEAELGRVRRGLRTLLMVSDSSRPGLRKKTRRR
ncbi:MAG TPA: helix-turn-helix domain-containing protein [Polyangiaceae bacterium]